MSQDFRNIICKVENRVAKIIINKPPLNVLTVESIEEIIAVLERADVDESICAVVITGIGDRALPGNFIFNTAMEYPTLLAKLVLKLN